MATDTTAGIRREWAEQLERDGYVEFRRSRRRLVYVLLPRAALVAVGVAIGVTWAEHTLGFVGGFTIATMGVWSVLDTLPRPGRGAALRVDHTGVTIRRWRPIHVPWGEVVNIAGGSKALYVEVLPTTLIRWAGRHWRARRAAAEMRDLVEVPDLAAPMSELGEWLDGEVDRRVPLTDDVDLWLAAEDDSALEFEETRRPLPLDRIDLEPELARRLDDWRCRSTAGLDPSLPAEERVAASDALASEGRALAAGIAAAIGPAARVRLAEDALADPVVEREWLPLSDRGQGWAARLERDGRVGFSRSWQSNLLFALFLPAMMLLPLAMVVNPFIAGWSGGAVATFAIGLLLLPLLVAVSISAVLDLLLRKPRLEVDANGLTFGTLRKSRLPWSGIIEVWTRQMGHGVEVPAAHVSRPALAAYTAARPRWVRWVPARLLYFGQDLVLPYCKRSETADLVTWLNWELVARAPLPRYLVMLPAGRSAAVMCRDTGRVVPLGRLPLRYSAGSALREWNRRAAPFADGDLPPALAEEGRTLAAQIEADLPTGHTMTLIDDLPDQA